MQRLLLRLLRSRMCLAAIRSFAPPSPLTSPAFVSHDENHGRVQQQPKHNLHRHRATASAPTIKCHACHAHQASNSPIVTADAPTISRPSLSSSLINTSKYDYHARKRCRILASAKLQSPTNKTYFAGKWKHNVVKPARIRPCWKQIHCEFRLIPP